jgi:hypothetical protein
MLSSSMNSLQASVEMQEILSNPCLRVRKMCVNVWNYHYPLKNVRSSWQVKWIIVLANKNHRYDFGSLYVSLEDKNLKPFLKEICFPIEWI